ncbi:MAG: zinc ribbon domain-containing protein [Nitrososphaerota archaeon]
MVSPIRLVVATSTSFAIMLLFSFVEHFSGGMRELIAVSGVLVSAILVSLLARSLIVSVIGMLVGGAIAMLLALSSPYIFNIQLQLWNPLAVLVVSGVFGRLLLVGIAVGISAGISSILRGFEHPKKEVTPPAEELVREVVEAKEEKPEPVTIPPPAKEVTAPEVVEKPIETVTCPHCKEDIPPDALFCPLCGKRVKES